MALSDFYEVRDFQQVSGENVLNVYHYIRGVASPTAQKVGDAFIETVIQPLKALQQVGLTRSVVEVENLGDPFDFATIDTSAEDGTRGGVNVSTFVAATIQLNRTRIDIKNGMKRFFVGTETDITGNFWDALFLTDLQALADVLVAPLVWTPDGPTSQGHLVVLKRFCTVLPSPPCTGTYRLPNTDLEIDNNNYQPITATARNTIRSQVSRKRLV